MANPSGPTDKDIVAMVVNTVNHWRQQRSMHAQKVAEYDALLRKIGVGMDKSVIEAMPSIVEGFSDDSSDSPSPPSGQTPGNNTPKIKISPFISGETLRRSNNESQDSSKAASSS